ncbi:MAG: hypothetical protein ABI855_05745 [Bacteroidota bacterium]
MEKQLQYLEEERVKIWKRLDELNKAIQKKTSDYEAGAKEAADRTEGYADAASANSISVANNLKELTEKLSEFQEGYESFKQLNQNIQEFFNSSKQNSEQVYNAATEIDNKKKETESTFQKIEELYGTYASNVEKLNKLEEIFVKGSDSAVKIQTIYDGVLGRKNEIDALYYQINGIKETDKETGVETEEIGLKHILEKSYDDITQKLKKTDEDLEAFKNKNLNDYANFSEEKKNEFGIFINASKDKYTNIEIEIQKLLPNALTAGLSAANSEKKQDEINERTGYTKTFNLAIGGLILVSLIPFAISLKSFLDNVAMETVIYRMPRLILSILPLYIPVLWVAYSANKKRNLSKRLIEEYSHKEVLSKTFEGLSRQIENIDDKDISKDLRIKLLYNILEVYSQNPGKLISDYNKSDHPIMDMLEKSENLTKAIDRVDGIPLLNKLVTPILKKQRDEAMNKVAEAFENLPGDASKVAGTTKISKP